MDSHDPTRVGQLWSAGRIADQLNEINQLRPHIILSGGWAWHFLSPPHDELKILHDHSDIDLFVHPANFMTFRTLVIARGFERIKTKYDNREFSRFRKSSDDGKIVLDAFLGSPPYVNIQGYRVVEPTHLLGLYDSIHQSIGCVAVQAAKKLLPTEILGNSTLKEF